MEITASPPAKPASSTRRASVEWPTLTLAAVIYGGWGLVTFFHADLPLYVLVPVGAWLLAWQGSLQHEIIHGHPTRWRRFNRFLGAIPLSLWLPYERYRVLHLCHHRDEVLTDPLDDPESYYWTEEHWQELGLVGRWLVKAQTRLVGRLVIGPFWSVSRYLLSEAKTMLAGDRHLARIWARHLAGCAVILAWLVFVCDFNPLAYAALILYPGTSLLMVRSFAEHKAEHAVFKRTAIVEDSPVMGLLFLYNNLHAVHHAHPTLPWYKLPAVYRANRAAFLERNGGLLYKGYGEVFRRFLLRAHDRPEHPLGRVPLDS
ncbi:fatty acid desaturase [Ancylobacter amanitiformis]|uniref:Fatty acid desaturase n=1 Tax=Ancylobacter amanitiformis TaxID=217069 RepID=A0ABU0LS88_9HYPH|nr:fatty acid desaturase [Ancylobacter amanitiformis]MDQ0511570.1 fatty acid desaturase [Ancylobacter amanitiformis]